MDYSNFDIEDFASDDSFIKWVIDGDPEASRFWKAYCQEKPELKIKIDKARNLLLNVRKAEQTFHASSQIKNIWQNIETEISGSPITKKSLISSFSPLRMAAAISIIAISTLSIWYGMREIHPGGNHDSEESIGQAEGFIEEVNTTGSVIRIHMSDGSVVSLENNSRLKYRKDYKGEIFREVYLRGEAFFDIAKNPRQPFLVYANELVTKVLGTSFRVQAYDNEQSIVVSVKEGKVSVYSVKEQTEKQGVLKSEVNGVVLTPNLRVVYTRTDDSFNKTLIEIPEIVNDKADDFDFTFDNAPVKKVFGLLEEAYGVEIIFDDEVMKNCFITVPLGNEPLVEKIKVICRTIGASYELIDAKIVIGSKGC